MIDPVEFGELKGEFNALKAQVTKMDASVEKLVALAENTKGGWRTLMVIGGIGGGVGAVLTKLAHVAGFLR